jgi:aryl-alcohol dehydrogenase-like predicted oxidoreductase
MWEEIPESRGKAALHAALDSGIDFFDTALVYGNGLSERLVGEVVREAGARERVRVATKVPPLSRIWPANPGVALRDAYPAHWIRECAEQSLRHLDIGPIDLLQLHTWTDAWVDEPEWHEALSALREEGKIRAFGVSVNDHDPGSALQVTRSGKIDSIQVIYNIFDQSPAAELFPAAAEAGVGVIARVPLDEGSLTGKYTKETIFPPGDFRGDYFSGERLGETVDRVERLRPLLERPGQTLAQGALRFCLSNPAVSTVIAGSTNPEHVRQNAEASDLGELDPATSAALREHAWARNFDR